MKRQRQEATLRPIGIPFRWLLATALALAIVAAAVLAGLASLNRAGPALAAVPPTNQPSVIDGDSLELDNRIVRLAGIDAPELGQRCRKEVGDWRCGLDAALALRKLISFGPVVCKPADSSDGAPLVSCMAGDRDLALSLLEQGYAVATAEAASALQAAEAKARDAKLGLWRGDFVHPADWRAGERMKDETADPESCSIKGSIDAQGNKVFYVPSDEEYAEIEVDTSRGARFFCSDDEAMLEGWKRFPRKNSLIGRAAQTGSKEDAASGNAQ